MITNVSYEHSLRHSFMHIKNMDISLNSYETKLLKETHVPGTLKLHIDSDISGNTLSYDISGLESMEKYLESHSLCYSEISMLMESLNTLLESLEEYMISENSVALTPSSIFFDHEKEEWKFTVVPGYKNEFNSDLSDFLSYLLKHINYKDDRAVIMGYSLFQESNKEFFQMTDLLRIVRSNMAKERPAFDIHTQINGTKADSINIKTKHQISTDGIFRPIDAGIVNSNSKNEKSNENTFSTHSVSATEASNPVSHIISDTVNDTELNFRSTPSDSGTFSPYVKSSVPYSYGRSPSGEEANISFSSDYGTDDYPTDDLFPGVEKHDITKEKNSKVLGLLSFSPKKKENPGKLKESPKEPDTIRDHIQEQNKDRSLKAKTFISILLMLLIPSLVWFLKGGLVFRKTLPLIIALEIGLCMMIALDYIMNKLPDESAE